MFEEVSIYWFGREAVAAQVVGVQRSWIMATANIELSDGTKVLVDGSPEEIARILNLYGGPDSPGTALVPIGQRLTPMQSGERRSHKATGPMQHLRDLIAENFFAECRHLSEVRRELETRGLIYPLTHLSNPIRRLVVSKELRRLREGRLWAYTTSA